MENKILILRDHDYYRSPSGKQIIGGNRKLYDAHLAIHLKDDGSFIVIKDRDNLSHDDVQEIIDRETGITPDKRILLGL